MRTGCVNDVTQQFSQQLSDDLAAAINGLSILRQHFGRETISAAIGEVSERLVARMVDGQRTPRGSFGHDLRLPDGQLIEVKARLADRYGDGVQFNFGRHTVSTTAAYCLAWRDDEVGTVRLDAAYRVDTVDLLEHWGCNQPKYCARTTLGKLRAALV